MPTQTIDPTALPPRDAYRILTSVVVPRPIAWVSSVGVDGTRNLAPFSFFNAVGFPLTVLVSIGRRGGSVKDTLRNVEETGQFVVNLVDVSLARQMNETSGEYDYQVDEFARAGLTAAASDVVRPARVAEAAVAMEAVLTQVVAVAGTAYTMVLGTVVRFHLREGLLRANGLVDAARLRPLARLGGDEYASLSEVFDMGRPTVPAPEPPSRSA
jgi:flavin reductase (DIM6/NTAB) family NADH-FMN oxidoreductase RutF